MNTRQLKGRDLAGRLKIERKDHHWLVPSQSGNGAYVVDVERVPPYCSCPDYELRGVKCKHIYAVEYVIRHEQETIRQTSVERETVCTPDGAATVTETITETVTETTKTTTRKRVTYRQDWPAYNAAQTQEKALFQDMLWALCEQIAEPELPPHRGRPRLKFAEMVFAACFKVYSTVSCRRFMSDLADAKAKGYLSRVPHFNSIFNYLELPEMTDLLRALIERSALPLRGIETKFAVDSTGFTTCRFVRWYDAKYGQEMERHDWLKCHFMCGVNTNVITAVEITGAYTHDTTQFPALISATARQQHPIYEVSADKAYSSRTNLALVERFGAEPYIPFRSNATGIYRSEDVWDRLYHFYMLRRETFLQHYHMRSLAESTVAMIKAKFGDALRSKGDTAQMNELLCKVLCHNICCVIQSMFELGVPVDLTFAPTA